ncbi:hypothetical protein BGK72_16070 [Streptomyces agglomeratus]|nr:hypothetical protein BGK72_16070 [Streptomyces agglomeratus]
MQEWQWNSARQLVHKASGKCMTPRGDAYATNGAVLTLWTCSSSADSQKFSMGNRAPWQWQTWSQYGGKCLTNYGGNFSNGTWVTLWACATGEGQPREQNWTI